MPGERNKNIVQNWQSTLFPLNLSKYSPKFRAYKRLKVPFPMQPSWEKHLHISKTIMPFAGVFTILNIETGYSIFNIYGITSCCPSLRSGQHLAPGGERLVPGLRCPLASQGPTPLHPNSPLSNPLEPPPPEPLLLALQIMYTKFG